MRMHSSLFTSLGILLLAPSAQAATDIHVTTFADTQDGLCDTHCSIREALQMAEQQPDRNRILLPAGEYLLELGELPVSGDVILSGPRGGKTIISGYGEYRVMSTSGTVRLEYLTVQDGRHGMAGAGIYNMGTLELWDCHVQYNRVDATSRDDGPHYNSGAGVLNAGVLNVFYGSFVGNEARYSNYEGEVPAEGAAIMNAGSLYVRETLFQANVAHGGENSGWGGAIHNSGSADIARSLFTRQESDGDGTALYNRGSMVISDSTISGNKSGRPAIFNQQNSALKLRHVTLVDNDEGVRNEGDLRVRNSLIAGNGVENCYSSMGSTYQASGLLLSQDYSNCAADIIVDDSLLFTQVLYPLADNNSTLQTHALRRGSPAVDAGVGTCSSQDQRGSSRPRDGDGDGVAVCDLGAYERPKP